VLMLELMGAVDSVWQRTLKQTDGQLSRPSRSRVGCPVSFFPNPRILFAKFLIGAFPSVAVARLLGLIPGIHYISDFKFEGTLAEMQLWPSPQGLSPSG